MNEADALDLLHASIWTILIGAGPAVGAAMVVGIAIALFQALTQIQEATLAFVPKIVAVLVALALGGAFIGAQVHSFAEQIYGRIEKGY
jgi:flagellar biosynthesis protein FliQ